MKLSPKLAPENDFLMNNGEGFFLVMPVRQVRNERHKEREVENPSKYQGLFWGTQKLADGWFATADGALLSPEAQSGFQTDMVTAERTFVHDGKKITEEMFVPDGIPAIAISYSGDFVELAFQPELDIRDRYSHQWSEYAARVEGGVCICSSGPWFAVIGEGEDVKPLRQYRYKFYPQDYERNDVAERWCFSPASFVGKRFFIGFGKSEAEAMENFRKLKEHYDELKLAKAERVRATLAKYRLRTPNEDLNKAFQLVVLQFLSLQNGGFLPASGDRWFAGDRGWLRDAMVSLEAYFELGLYEKARQILSSWLVPDLQGQDGLFPNRLAGKPEWQNTGLDGTLWLLRRAGEYVLLTGDRRWFDDKGELLRRALSSIIDDRMTNRGYVISKPCETWMDTKFTPREGHPIEVQSLFIYDCLLFAKLFEEKFSDRLLHIGAMAMNTLNSFKCRAQVGGVERHYLADHLSPKLEKPLAITPNQLIALDCGIVDEELEADILAIVREKLAGKGIRTLAPDEPGYFEKHVGDQSYHRGTQWPWLNYIAVKREIKAGHPERAYNFYIYPLLGDILSRNVGGVPELYNGDGSPASCPRYQTWSMASFIISCKEYERALTKQPKLSAP